MSEQETENKDERERESVRNRGERVRKRDERKRVGRIKKRAIERARVYSNRTETDGLRSGQQIYLLLRQPAGH